MRSNPRIHARRVAPALLSVMLVLISSTSCGPSRDTLKFADASAVWWTAPTVVALDHNLFERHGIRVQAFDVQTGLASKNAVVGGTADVGLVASTPLAMGAYSRESVIVLGSYVESKSLLSLVTSESWDAASSGVIPQGPIAIVRGTISEFYLFEYLKKNGLAAAKGTPEAPELAVRPPDIPNLLKNGSAQSAVIWEPFASLAANSGFRANRYEDLYTLRLFLITRPEVLKKKRAALTKFVQAVDEACNLIRAKPDDYRRELEAKYGYENGFLVPVWDKVDFSLRFDYEQMKALIRKDAEISAQIGSTSGELPNLDHLFDYQFPKDAR